MTSKIVVNNIEADSGINTVTFGGDISGNLIGNVTGNVNATGVSTFSDTVNVGAGKSVRIFGSASGYSDLIAPAVAGDQTFTLPGTGGTLDRLNRAGNVLQVVNYQTGSNASGTTTIPFDDTIPQNTEGTEFMTLAVTPTSASSKLLIEVQAFIGGSAAVTYIGALFQDSTASALATVSTYLATSGGSLILSLNHYMIAGTTSSTTFKFRAGGNSASTTYINATSATRAFGGAAASSITITEIAA